MKGIYKEKVNPGKVHVKDFDLKSRIVKGYFASFDTIDAHNDLFVRGAFAKSIRENGPTGGNRIAHLLQHNPFLPLGKILSLVETNEGVEFESEIPDTTYGLDTLKLYDAGILKEHSVGINILQGEMKEGYYEIREAKLWEGSTVTWGANENTPFLGFKTKGISLEKPSVIERIDLITKAIRKGDYSDDTFKYLEIAMVQLKSSLIEDSKPVTTTLEVVEPKEAVKLYKCFTDNLILS